MKNKKSRKVNRVVEYKVNPYITLKLESGKTFIYVNGRRFIQCIRLILNIPKHDIPLYDEIDSIDEAAELYQKHIFQNRIIVADRILTPIINQKHDITPEQEFWGHCSNIQAWVEHEYDTRILKSNISFPLLRELTLAGDPLAKKVFKEEIALRLESGYPSVVQYLIEQGFIKHFTPFEFKTILDSTKLIENLSSNFQTLYKFLKSSVSKFPDVLKEILIKILKLPNGKNILIQSISEVVKTSLSRFTYQFLKSIRKALESLLGLPDLEQEKDVIDCISMIEVLIEKGIYRIPSPTDNFIPSPRPAAIPNQENIFQDLQYLHKLRHLQPRCSYCGKLIPKGLDTCDWCGHQKEDDEGGFYPYPFTPKPPGGAAGKAKRKVTVPIHAEQRI
ncbi:MAG: hypothetical protein ACFE85_14740 [Candidatus Hodarchaeota archaeon]